MALPTKSATRAFEIPTELIEQYKIALAGLADLRLVTLLLFNSFEEVMKSFAAWRLGCSVEQLPSQISNSSSLLFQLVLVDNKDLRKRTEQLSNLRNTIAHRFHTEEYKPKLHIFLKDVLELEMVPEGDALRTALLDGVFGLALQVAAHLMDLSERGEIPFPGLSMELAASK